VLERFGQLIIVVDTFLLQIPGQTRIGGNAKIPTVIYYNQDGAVCAIGAETEREGIEAIAEESNWIKAEW
jgi:hypothetical protein